MPGPGSGRYTNYTAPADIPLPGRPGKSSADAYKDRYKLFNAKADAEKGAFFGEGGENVKDYVATAAAILEAGVGDKQMFPTAVNMAYGPSAYGSGAPNLADTQLNRAGDPANPYVPDISSPGAVEGSTNVDPQTKTGNGALAPDVIKPTYVLPNSKVGQNANNLGTQSPHLTAPSVGASPIGSELVKGKSKGTDQG